MRQKQIEQPVGGPSGLTWDVAESLPVSETIKSQTGPLKQHFAAYKERLRNLAACGINTVCYNFTPVLDWTRTDLSYPLPHGGHAMRFDLLDFVVFDCLILSRHGAQLHYSDEIVETARARFTQLSDAERRALTNNITSGLPGASAYWSLEDVRQHLNAY